MSFEKGDLETKYTQLINVKALETGEYQLSIALSVFMIHIIWLSSLAHKY